MGRIGGTELLLILAVALLIFGPSKLADLGKGLGEGLKNFKRGITDDDSKRAKPDGSTAAAELPRTDPTDPGKPPSTVN